MHMKILSWFPAEGKDFMNKLKALPDEERCKAYIKDRLEGLDYAQLKLIYYIMLNLEADKSENVEVG